MTHGTVPAAPAAEATEGLLVVPAGALAALNLPEPAGLIEGQRRGALCVWCTARLTLETAMDLGELQGSVGRWWPRSCPACIAARAHRGLFEHTPECKACIAKAGQCEIGLVLYRLVREGRR